MNEQLAAGPGTAPELFVMTGMPRSGTTYLAAVLHNPPKVITISEAQGAWKNLMREQGTKERGARALAIMWEFRERVIAGEAMPSLETTPGFQGRNRIDTWNQKKGTQSYRVDAGFSLGMKNPEVFLEMLGVFLDAGLRCLVSVRHPLGIINSWASQLSRRQAQGKPVEGTFGNGESVSFSSGSRDPVQRRIDLHNHFAAKILHHSGHAGLLYVRYEDWFADPGQLSRVAAFAGIPCLGQLRPPPIPPPPVELDADEQDRILSGCWVAAEFGYASADGRLLPPAEPQAPHQHGS